VTLAVLDLLDLEADTLEGVEEAVALPKEAFLGAIVVHRRKFKEKSK
jgi:hypothetical protein